MLLISRDVTERVRIHQALRVSEERYRMLAETTHDLVIELDAEGKIVYVSPNSLPTLGYAPARDGGDPALRAAPPRRRRAAGASPS